MSSFMRMTHAFCVNSVKRFYRRIDSGNTHVIQC